MRLAAVALLCLATPLAFAQDPETETDDEVALEDRVTVTATRTERSIDDVPATVTVIGDRQIERTVSQDIRDLVRYEPGVSVSGGDRFGLNGFTIRGIGGDRVLTQVDGVQVADEFSFGPFLSARRDFVDVDALKAVEIVRGPASSLYGSDAIGGVVSFITKDPRDYLRGRGEPAFYSLKGGATGDDDGFMQTGTIAGAGDTLGGMFVFSNRNGHEQTTFGGVGGTGAGRAQADPLEYSTRNALGKLVFEPAEDHTLRLTVENYDTSVDSNVLSASGAVVMGVVTLSSEGADERTRSRTSVEYDFGGGAGVFDRMLVRVHQQDSETEQFTTQLRDSAGVQQIRTRDSFFEQTTHGLDLMFHKSLMGAGALHDVVYGVEYDLTDSSSLRDGGTVVAATNAPVFEFNPLPTRDFPLSESREIAAFVQDEMSLMDDRLRITPGLRYDRYDMDPRLDPVYLNGSPGAPVPVPYSDDQLSLKLGVLYRLTGAVGVFTQYTEGFRAPPYDDINVGFTNLLGGYTTLSNPNLVAESSESLEAGFRVHGEAVRFRISAYYNRYEDFIESLAALGFNPISGLLEFQSVNRDRVVIKGVEAGATVPLQYGLTVLTSASVTRGEDRTTGQPLNSVDPAKAVVGLDWRPDGRKWNAQFAITGVGAKDRVDHTGAAVAFFETPGHVTYDLLAEYRFNRDAVVNLGVFNLTDKRYWEWGDVAGREFDDPALARFTRPGRNAALTFRYAF